MKYIKFLLLLLISSSFLFSAPIEKNIEFYNGKLKFGGTLALPDTAKKHPALILITGSGQQDRDENIFEFKIFKQISDYLVKSGYAVFRYDDRGIGESKNSKKDFDSITFIDFAGDAYAALQAIKSNKNIDNKKIGILGHSEGGIIASYLQVKYPTEVRFLILMASPAVKGSITSNYQVEYTNRKNGITGKEFDEKMKAQHSVMQAIEANAPDSVLKNIFKQTIISSYEYMNAAQKKSIADLDRYSESMANSMVKQNSTPYLKLYITYDPVQALEKVDCPVLALFGEKDFQVPPEINLEPLKNAFKNRKNLLKVCVIKNANHLFQKAKTGGFDEYAKLPKKFTKDFLPAIRKWLDKNVRK